MNTVWKKDRIADVVGLLIGLGLFFSPCAVGFSAESPMDWNAWLSGIIIIAALAVAALAVFAEWPVANSRHRRLVAVSPWGAAFLV